MKQNNNNNIMNENGSGETQGVVEEHKDSHGRSGTIILDQYQPESPAESIVATQLDEIVVALGRKEDRNQRPVVLHRRQGYSPLSPSERRSWLQLCKEGSTRAMLSESSSRAGWTSRSQGYIPWPRWNQQPRQV